MNAEPGRLAAYADLVAAVLDLRSTAPRQAFDAALADAVAAGTISGDLARQLRQLQRAGERAIVEQAAAVLPPALDALQGTLSESRGSESLGSESRVAAAPAPLASAAGPAQPADVTKPADDAREIPGRDEADEAAPAPVVELQARRLLVAGLRPLPPPIHRGTLP